MQVFNISEIEKFQSFFKEHGWLHIRNVFSNNEIENLRSNAYKMQSEGFKGDVLSFTSTSPLVYDERILSVVKALLETESPVYFGDSSGYNIGSSGSAGFHKDNPDKFDGNNPDWKSEYTILRIGIYCQSHIDYSASVSLRDKSHNTINCETGKPFFVGNDAGDLVIWSLRTSHSGNSLRLKFAPKLFVHPILYSKIPKFLVKGEEKERVAYFLTYGKNDLHLRRYLTYLLNREYMVSSWQQSKYSKEIIEQVKKSNSLQLINMYEVVKDIDISTVNRAHNELPESLDYFEPVII